MLIYVKNMKKKNFLRTDGRTTQNYSSEPHKIGQDDVMSSYKIFFLVKNETIYLMQIN